MSPTAATDDFDGLQIINRQLPSDRVSQQTIDVIKASWKPNTRKSYESILKQWITFCSTRNYDISPPSVYAVLAFLTELFGKGLSFSHINKARSALSVTLSINDNKIGDHPLICRFMQGLRNLRPPLPKYPVTWNAKDLLTFLKNWKVTESSPLRDITTKLATLLTCLAVQRVHTISLIDSRNIKFDTDATYLYIFEDLKVQRNRPKFVITLPALHENDPLGTSKLLRIYLDTTATFRRCNTQEGFPDRLFISHVKPYRPVATDTLARLIRGVLKKAGIDTTVFGAHSMRGAAASAAHNSNAPLDAILSAGDWSSARTFNRHYCRSNAFLPHSQVARILTSCITDND